MTPIIGISTNLHTVDKGKFLGMERIYVNKDYIDAVVKAGGIPLLLPPVADRAPLSGMPKSAMVLFSRAEEISTPSYTETSLIPAWRNFIPDSIGHNGR